MDNGFTTLITAEQLLSHINDKNWLIVDCSFYLPTPDQGYAEYLKDHISNAVYAHLNNDLSGKVTPTSGRHPLPEHQNFMTVLGKWGFRPDMQVVVYDSTGGAMASARLWWLLNYYGFTRVALLDGGILDWLRKGYPVTSQITDKNKTVVNLKPDPKMTMDAQAIRAITKDDGFRILDARARNRYKGMEEVIDTLAGHIPGAVSATVTDFQDEDQYFKPIDEIKTMLDHLLGDVQAQNSVYYCGSGVTAALGVFVMAYAGYNKCRLYPGSWSEWIKQPWAEIAVHE